MEYTSFSRCERRIDGKHVFSGGIADKLGNRYEAKWLVRLLLDVLQGRAQWLRFEGVEKEFEGFECALGRNGVVEWHQSKINQTRDNWTIGRLGREGVLAAFHQRLKGLETDRCWFVSNDPSKGLQRLLHAAKLTRNATELPSNLSEHDRQDFDTLKTEWDVNDADLWNWLRRCECHAVPSQELEGLIAAYGELLFFGPADLLFPVLRDYLERHFNQTLTAEKLREDLRNIGGFRLKEWSLDPTLRQHLAQETDAYLSSYSPFGAGGTEIPRQQADQLLHSILDPNGPQLLLLTGVAGSGKSGVVRQLVHKLRESSVTHTAFRVDRHLTLTHPREFGEATTGRPESPVVTLKGLEPTGIAALIIDQVDAVSELSGRNGTVKDAVLRMVDEARRFNSVKVVLVCRTFDFDGDRRLKVLDQQERVERIEVPLLNWVDEVVPMLKDRGLKPDAITDKQRKLLLLPLHLAVFLEVAMDAPAFQTRNDLLAALLHRKELAIRERGRPHWSTEVVLTEMAQWMSSHQRLSVPTALVSQHPGAMDLLTSEGLVVRSSSEIGFFHESLFDYLYAQAFSTGEQSLVELLSSTEQHLFRRTQVRQILENLRQGDAGRYLRELRSVLFHDDIRYHIKLAVAQWVGTLPDPDPMERSIVFCLDSGTDSFNPLFRIAALGSKGWFDSLHEIGWIADVLESGSSDRQEAILWWLHNRAVEDPTQVIDLLRPWWAKDQERGQRLLAWLSMALYRASDSVLLTLCTDVIRSCPPGLFETEDAGHDSSFWFVGKSSAKDGAAIFAALFDAWFTRFPDHHPFDRTEIDGIRRGFGQSTLHDLSKIAQQAPRAFLNTTIPNLVRSIEIVNRNIAEKGYDYSFSHRRQHDPVSTDNLILNFTASALRQLGSDSPGDALHYLEQVSASSHPALLHLHLECIAANGEGLAPHLLTLLEQDALFEAGWSGAEWRSLADATSSAIPYLNDADRQRVEGVILDHNPELAWAKRQARELFESESIAPHERPKQVPDLLRFSRFEQWCILETIGPERLSVRARRRLDELRRKFPSRELPQPSEIQMRAVRSPIPSDRIARLSDDQWLRAIAKYDSDRMRRHLHDAILGGARQLARELETATKNDPRRFASLAECLPEDANPDYLSAILSGLAGSESVDTSSLQRAVSAAHARPGTPFGKEIAGVFQSHPDLAADTEMFNILIWYMENGEADTEEMIDRELTKREIIKIEDLISAAGSLHLRGINGARGAATESLAAVVWQLPECTGAAWESVEKRIALEPSISVRCALTRVLHALFNDDKDRCSAAMEALLRPPSGSAIREPPPDSTLWLAPATTHQGVDLFRYLRYWTPDTARRLIHTLVATGDEHQQLIGAWHLFWWSFDYPEDQAEADRLIGVDPHHRRLAADVAAHALGTGERQERATQQLEDFFDDEDEHVRKEAADVFFHFEPGDIARFPTLCERFVESCALRDNSRAFLRALAAANCDIAVYVVRATERLLDALADGSATRAQVHGKMRDLSGLLKREYAASEADPGLRTRLLDLLDRMLALEVGGADELAEAQERN